ncbi:AMP-binding protein, partial [Rheinheimera baltica]|uniref:AMP-binding protein n=1 Tax=Rheinheimera baltica TaxID=67576 RepID=UPI00273E7979
TALAAYQHQTPPFEMVVETLLPERGAQQRPLFQIMFTLQNNERQAIALPGLTLCPLQATETPAKFDLTLAMAETEQGLTAHWEYDAGLFDPDTISTLADSFALLLNAICQQPDAPLSTLPIVPASQHRYLQQTRQFTADYPVSSGLTELFSEQVRQRPAAIAMYSGTSAITYQTLDLQANRLAACLRRHGVQPGELVAFSLERGPNMVVAILAILKAGAAYLPLDPEYPQSRIQFMLEDSQARLVLTEQDTDAMLSVLPVRRLRLDDATLLADDDTLTAMTDHRPAQERLAYVIYTSGSTGNPKGVMVRQHNIVRLVCNSHYVQLAPEQVIAQASNCSFDAATFEIWGALLNGARLHFIDKHTLLDCKALCHTLQQHHVSVLFVTTAIFNQMAWQQPDGFATLDTLLFGGEHVDNGAVARILTAGKPTTLLHVYGPTENTTFSTSYNITQPEADSYPIGLAIDGTASRIIGA